MVNLLFCFANENTNIDTGIHIRTLTHMKVCILAPMNVLFDEITRPTNPTIGYIL